MKRVFVIVLDSVGVGAAPDAADFGDVGSNTLKSCFDTGLLEVPNLLSMGLGSIPGVDYLPSCPDPIASYGRMQERSRGKDTTTGHWEIAGLTSESPMPTYPQGFPQEIINAFEAATGRGVLVNRPYSGTEVIRDYGKEHLETGKLIVYTSADSVFQIAAHESIVPPELLYDYCRAARKLLTGPNGVGRVIARPFTGDWPFTRTENRRDFSLEPPGPTMLDVVSQAGLHMISVGKISDIFAGRGVTRAVAAHNNLEGMAATLVLGCERFHGLCFINLVDFDMLYGHRNDREGYARALNAFDGFLSEFLPMLDHQDLLLITADHGCDPGYPTTDHTREYVPLLVYSPGIEPRALGTRDGFGDVAATVLDALGLSGDFGNSVL